MGYCQRLSSYFVFGFFVIALQNPLSAQELTPPSNIFQAIDHIVYVVPNLEEAIVQIKNSFGITPTLGGSHPGRMAAS